MKHTVKNWFGDKTLQNYFNDDFKRNKVGKLAFPPTMIKSFTRNGATLDQAMVDKMADSLGQSIIDAIVKKHFNMTAFKFEYMIGEHQEYLKEAVCYEMQEVIFNKKVMERNGGASISTPSYTIGVDSTNWLFTYDELSIRTKELVALADIPNYKVVGDGFIGRVSYNTAKSELIVYKWNNNELGKELVAKGHEGQAYLNFARAIASITVLTTTGVKVEKYDYVLIKKDDIDEVLRFNGGDYTNQDNWVRVDTLPIDGDRYLVYKNYVLAGTHKDENKGDTLDYTSAKNGEVLMYNSTTGKGEWTAPNIVGDFTKIQFISTFGKIDFTKFDRWYFVQDMEGQLGFAVGEEALVYVLDGANIAGFPTSGHDANLKANDWTKINAIDIIDFGAVTGGPAGVVHHFGDLDDDAQRINFMNGVEVGQWYTFNINAVPYMVNVLSGDKTTKFTWSGWRIVGGKVEVVDGTTTSTAHTENGLSIDQKIDNKIALLPTPLTGNYTSQADNLKVMLDLENLSSGLTKEYTIPNGLTTATVGGCEIAMDSTVGGEVKTKTQGFDLRGWDKSKPVYLSMTFHAGATYLWVELKLEAVAGDDTKLKITNYKSGAAGSEMNTFGVKSIQFKGGN